MIIFFFSKKLEVPHHNVISSGGAVNETESLRFSGSSEVFTHPAQT